MIVCSIVFIARIPSVKHGDGYDLCRMDVLEQRSHRQRHLFTFRFKLSDNGLTYLTDAIPFVTFAGLTYLTDAIPFVTFAGPHPLHVIVERSKGLAVDLISRLKPLQQTV